MNVNKYAISKDVTCKNIENSRLLLENVAIQSKTGQSKSGVNAVNTNEPIRLSFQLMTRAEPVAMVIATIHSLLAIKADDDEILIIDNNNTQTALYQPLADYCASLDESHKVRFYHVDKVANFKSGALNLALGLMDPNASHIVVVDSDYQALAHARSAIIAAIEKHPTHALLQFPQFYRDINLSDVHNELNHYFNYHLYRPFNRIRALSTGTFAVIRREALIQLKGWSGASITEDAQMGVLMHKQGLKSQFMPQVIASGLLPTTLPDLLCQRQRWIYGNMQVLSAYFTSTQPDTLIATPAQLNLKENISLSLLERFTYMCAHLSQLCAWVNFTGLFILLQLATLLIIVSALLSGANMDLQSLLTPLYIVYASYILFLGRRLWAYRHDDAPLNKPFNSLNNDNRNYDNTNGLGLNSAISDGSESVKKQLRAWLLHLNFWELGALSWIPVLWGREKPFVCTPKQAVSSTARSTFVANVVVLPKLLLVLNIITALIVAPFSPLYSPLLFVCALAICLIKILAAYIIFQNYSYQKPTAQIIKFKTIDTKKALSQSTNNAISLSKRTINHRFMDNKDEIANS